MRPTLRFVPVKREETQRAAMVFRSLDLLIRQRTQAINALRFGLAPLVRSGAGLTAHLPTIVKDTKQKARQHLAQGDCGYPA